MKVFIKDIRPEGIDVDYRIAAEDIGLTEKDYLHFIEPVTVRAHLERAENTVLARIHINSRYKSYCCRTLVDVERDWAQEFALDFEISPDTEFIEMDEDIRQELILSLPMRILSDEENEKDEELAKKEPQRVQAASEEQEKTYQPFKHLKLK